MARNSSSRVHGNQLVFVFANPAVSGGVSLFLVPNEFAAQSFQFLVKIENFLRVNASFAPVIPSFIVPVNRAAQPALQTDQNVDERALDVPCNTLDLVVSHCRRSADRTCLIG
jgi:heme/copper-type cytochrome/quinol oxidase subunit 1